MNNTPRTVVKRSHLAALALALAVVPFAAGPADAATKHRHAKTKHAVTKTVTAKRCGRQARRRRRGRRRPAPRPPPAVTSVISIGGYVFYNLTYAEAVDAYAAAVAAAPAGYTPPPVTSVSVTTTIGNG